MLYPPPPQASKGGSILMHTDEEVSKVSGWMSTTLDIMGKRYVYYTNKIHQSLNDAL